MKKLILTAAAAIAIAVGAAPAFAGEGIVSQSANIQAGGAAYPAGVVQSLLGK